MGGFILTVPMREWFPYLRVFFEFQADYVKMKGKNEQPSSDHLPRGRGAH
jgi:hypothetical protein